MGGGRTAARLTSAVLAAALAVLVSAPSAWAGPPRPTVDPNAPTPTTPYPGGPPQGFGPDGRTIGGEQLNTRGVVVAAGTAPLPAGLTAAGWLVADAGTGDVLAARDPHGRYYPASTLKTLTLLTLVPLLDPSRIVVGTVEDENIEGSRAGIVHGGQYPVSLLFQALILQSGNDAANALARAAGGVDVTVAAMNETAQDIGAFDTVAGTPSGLDVAGQSSSPYDLALIFRALISDPTTAALLVTRTAQMPAVEGLSAGYQIQSQNPLLLTYPGNLGGKTGFTDAARHTFVTAAERGGRRLVVSVMDTENTPLRAPDQAAQLLDWGFAVPAGTPGVGTLVTHADLTPSPAATAAISPRTVRTTPRAAPTSRFPVVPVTLAATAVLLMAGAAAGRRRALRPLPHGDVDPSVRRAPARRPSGDPATPPEPDGGTPSTLP